MKTLNLSCESVAIAGRTVQSILNREYGVNREVAYNGPTYQPVTLSFLCTEDWAAKKIFDAWNNMIVDIGNGYDVAYYSEYAKATMTVSALDKKADLKAPKYADVPDPCLVCIPTSACLSKIASMRSST